MKRILLSLACLAASHLNALAYTVVVDMFIVAEAGFAASGSPFNGYIMLGTFAAGADPATEAPATLFTKFRPWAPDLTVQQNGTVDLDGSLSGTPPSFIAVVNGQFADVTNGTSASIGNNSLLTSYYSTEYQLKPVYAWVSDTQNPANATTFSIFLTPYFWEATLNVIGGLSTGVSLGNDGTTTRVRDGGVSLGAQTTTPLNAILSIGTHPTSVVEGATASVTITRSGKLTDAVTVAYTVTASTPADLGSVTPASPLSFAANETSKVLSVPINNNALADGARTFQITLLNPSTGAVLGTPASVTINITDDEVSMPGTLSLSAATYAAAENVAGGNLAVIVRRTGGSDGAVSATLATTIGSATSPADFTAVSQSVNFAAGDAADKSITITLSDDTTFEGDETFTIGLSAATGGATLGTPTSATVTITENDAPPTAGSLSFTAATFSGSESAGTITVGVARSGGTTGAISVQYATSDGTAIAPGDYTSTTGSLSWATGESGAKTFTVPVIDNSMDAVDKTFNVALSNPTGGAALAAPTSAVVTLTDDDTAGIFAFADTTANVAETAGQVTLTINRTLGTAGAVDILVSTAAGPAPAAATGDFEALTNRTVSFANGQTSATVTIGVVDNAVFSGNRNFQATLTSGGGGAIIGANATATVTITDNDTPLPGRFSFDAATYSAAEGTATVTLTVIRTDGSDGEARVTYTALNGTALAPGDFPATTGQLIFAQGDVSETFTVPINDDAIAENAESVTVKLTTPTGGAALGSRTTATVSIADNEPTYRLSAATYPAEEGSSVSIRVIRENGLSVPRSVDYRITNGSAIAGRDFVAASGSLLFDAGVAEQTISIPIVDDRTPEGAETFRVTLVKVNPSDLQVGLSTPSVAVVTIARSDATEQPDLSGNGDSGFVGAGILNSTLTGQGVIRTVSGSSAAGFTVRVRNAGNAPDSIKLTGVAGGSAASGVVRITRNGANVTTAVLSATGLTLANIPAGGTVELKVSVSANSGRQYTGWGVTLTGASAGTTSKADTVRVGVVRR